MSAGILEAAAIKTTTLVTNYFFFFKLPNDTSGYGLNKDLELFTKALMLAWFHPCFKIHTCRPYHVKLMARRLDSAKQVILNGPLSVCFHALQTLLQPNFVSNFFLCRMLGCVQVFISHYNNIDNVAPFVL